MSSDDVVTLSRLKIGEVASETGIPIKTIRYYDDLGLLAPSVSRSHKGYRLFDETVFNRLAFIKRAQSLGLNLSEIQEILTVHDQGDLPCGVVKERLLQKLNAIEEQIKALTILKIELQGILCGWQEMPKPDEIDRTICPNIQINV
ncbi:heavy metal-responsive transcriptional regulator [Gloeothece verrucosa]|uniref:Transcriptional regulator, MerR family n=1 Tax=Gloeothece verrucosa (strain PCC 7822) TaxID=497965 RepID=E0UGW1_GLOV7|nr:heavy metal-responsive transcriptional regulator [Gloeothece verrucosa]ADN14442.1 transcriptional regulator, MerR family [Gloeothece verrucosa PCC 7822]